MPENQERKVILSGIQPTGKIHLGNLVGAIKNWVAMQETYDCYFTIVDQHAITIRPTAAELRSACLDMAAMLLAAGLDPDKCALFVQSHVVEHSQLAWVLNCSTMMGELQKMTQFKDKAAKQPENVNVGLFAYPVLQAADILLYQADLVPVGNDQKQHLELTRNIAERFNHHYSPTFKLPDPYIPKVGARIMSLQEPEKKMSKSDENEKATIFIADDDNAIKNKIKRAVTDSDSEVKYSEDKAGVSNLIDLHSLATGKSREEIESDFVGKGYGDFKAAVAESVADYVRPIRKKFLELRKDKKYLQEVLTQGAEKARRRAIKTVRKVYKKVGFPQF